MVCYRSTGGGIWTHAELAEHLWRTHGIRASRSAMQRSCHKLGIRVYRPTYRFLRGDESKQGLAREELAILKKSGGRRDRPAKSV